MTTSTPRPPSAGLLAWRQTLRDFRAGELRLLAVAVMLAVAALTAVGFFADRLNAGLARDARQLLGGDAVISSDKPPGPRCWRRRALWAWRCRPAPPSPAWAGRRTTRAVRRAWCR
jgi:putative ABC transport system permease protein